MERSVIAELQRLLTNWRAYGATEHLGRQILRDTRRDVTKQLQSELQSRATLTWEVVGWVVEYCIEGPDQRRHSLERLAGLWCHENGGIPPSEYRGRIIHEEVTVREALATATPAAANMPTTDDIQDVNGKLQYEADVQTIESLRARIRDLEADTDDKRRIHNGEIQQLYGHIEYLERRTSQLQDHIDGDARRTAGLIEANAVVSGSVTHAKQEAEAAQAAESAIREELRATIQRAHERERELVTKISQLEDEVTGLRRELTSVRSERDEALEALALVPEKYRRMGQGRSKKSLEDPSIWTAGVRRSSPLE